MVDHAAYAQAFNTRWQRANDEPYEYLIRHGPSGDEFVKAPDGTPARRPVFRRTEAESFWPDSVLVMATHNGKELAFVVPKSALTDDPAWFPHALRGLIQAIRSVTGGESP